MTEIYNLELGLGYTLSSFGADLLSVNFNATDVITYEDWLESSNQPYFNRQSSQYTIGTFKFLVQGSSQTVVDERIAALTRMIRHSKITIDNFRFFFVGYLNNMTVDKINGKGSIVEYEMKGRKLCDSQTITIPMKDEDGYYADNTVDVTFKGMAKVPCKITIDIPETTGTSTTGQFTVEVKNGNTTISSTTYKMPIPTAITSRSIFEFDGITGRVRYRAYNGSTWYNAIDYYGNSFLPSIDTTGGNKLKFSSPDININQATITYNGRFE